ncbi:sulfate permease, SulP family [Parapedobacter composti]|uniref:Sulfate permease, SulP family n=1 Tax=Parapedobacter composti TaxID=623281 RepID=A0A1I1EUW0_9SPHI|nr:SulP family inorganic anion transporter [Parapedobacter composti]SFB90757.1 sulfate permease, SulP family [Parapedobacter composti]
MFGTRASAFLKLSKRDLKYDLPASIVVFLVALPLCLGIAMASGAPLFAGLLTGIIGGIVVASFSGSQLSVSGPAAGLTVIVLGAIQDLGAYETFLMAVVLAGVVQVVLGIIKAGMIGNYFPSSVIIGMLAAIGIIIILKQLPHAVGYDAAYFGEESFLQQNQENTFSALQNALGAINYGATIICLISLAILILWPKFKKLKLIPAPLVVVILAVGLSRAFEGTSLALNADHLVVIPVVQSFGEFLGLFTFPDFTQILNQDVWIAAFTIAIIASLETLLSLEAVDKIDPFKRVSPTNRELFAQGIGNTTSGLLGGIPMTSVIVRSSANVNAGGRTRQSAILHGIWLLLAVVTIPQIINLIPLACLAAILLHTGYKLANPASFKGMWHKGLDQFIPFIVTILAVVFTDLLTGVGVGLLVAMFYILKNNLTNAFEYDIDENEDGAKITFTLAEEVTFLNKAAIQKALYGLPKRINEIVIDGSHSRFIDKDVIEVIKDFEQNAVTKGKSIELVGIVNKKNVPNIKRFTQSILKNDALKKKTIKQTTSETIEK